MTGEAVPGSTIPPAVSTTLLTFLLADVRGYTPFTLERGDEVAARLTARFAEICEEVVGSHEGEIIGMRGDEALCVFPSARNALRCAVTLQASFEASMEQDPSVPLHVGVGLDAGEAIPIKGDYRGGALNLAARLCSLASAGEVLASDAVIHLAGRIEGVSYRERGQVSLKGFADPVMVIDVVPEQTGRHAEAGDAAIGEMQPLSQDLPIGGFLGALPTNSLVARDQELRQLENIVDLVANGQGRLVLLSGEPGAGKTRLAQEVTLRLRDRGFLVAAGRCYESEQTVPYYPFLEAVATAYRLASPALRENAASRWPYLGALLPDEIPLPAASSGQDQQVRVLRAVTGFLLQLAGIVPLALLVDDLQWADAASLKLLHALARDTRSQPIVLLGTYRDVEVGRHHPLEETLRDLEREGLAERIAVRRLDQDGTGGLVASIIGEDSVSHEMAEVVHRRTEGNPFFVQQVVRVLVERGDIYEDDGRWTRKDIAEIAVPESIRSAVGQRVARLGDTTQEVLQQASVLGQAFSFDDLLSLSRLDEDALDDALAEAAKAGLVRSEEGERYAFDHALTQQMLYGELSPRRRRRLHLRSGEALEGLPEAVREGRVTELAWHFLHADDPERALRYAMAAGDAASRVFAYGDAEGQYRNAAELARDLGEDQREIDAWERLGGVLYRAGRHGEAVETLEQAVERAERLQDRERALELLGRLGEAHTFGGTAAVGIERLEPVVRAFEGVEQEERPPAQMADVYAALAMLYFVSGHWNQILPTAETAITYAKATGNERARGIAHVLRSSGLSHADRLVEAQSAADCAAEIGERLGDHWLRAFGLWHHGVYSQALGQLEEAEDFVRRAIAVAEGAALTDLATMIRTALTEILVCRGRWAEARREGERAIEVSRSLGRRFVGSYPLINLGQVLLLQGEEEQGLRYLHEALDMATGGDDLQGAAYTQVLLAQRELWENRAADALARLEPVVERLRRVGNDRWDPFYVWAQAKAGSEERAAEELAVARGRAMVRQARVELPIVHLAAVTLAMRQARWDDAVAELEAGLALTREIGLPYIEAQLLAEYGRLEMSRNEPARAQARLEEARAVFQQLGARPDVERTERLLVALGQRLFS